MSGGTPSNAMVLAAGLGKRMRPITDRIPKPLVEIAGRTLLDRGLDALERAGVSRAVVNIHHLGEQIRAHLERRRGGMELPVSDESEGLLDSAGGIVKALPLLGDRPFFILNADTFWLDPPDMPDLRRLALAWRPGEMDILLMLASLDKATGHGGGTDFLLGQDGRLSRSARRADGLVYAGVAIVDPQIFDGAPSGPHSLNLYFDRAIAAGRLHGVEMAGRWITVGTPEAIAAAEAVIARHGGAGG